MMKKTATLLTLLFALAFVGGCCRGPQCPGGMAPGMHHQGGPCPNCPKGGPGGMAPGAMGAPGAAMPSPSSAIYWCGSATDGACSGISAAPGTCPDGTPMNAGHVVFMEGTTAFVCTCGASCSCAIDPKDHAKCGCGKPIRQIDLAGTGLYFCNCGGSCACNTLSSGPGKCRCGMDLHQAK